MATLARDYFWCLRWSAQSAERKLQEVCDSIESLQKFEDIDVLNRRHYLRKHIRKCISEVLETVDFISPAAEPIRKAMSDLQKKIESALQPLEAEDGEASTVVAQLMIAVALLPLILAACDDARLASNNLSRAADNFEIDRRIVFKPQAIVPDFDFRGSTEELLENASELNQQ